LELLSGDVAPKLVILTGAAGVGKTGALGALSGAFLEKRIRVIPIPRGGALAGILLDALSSLGLSGRYPPGAPEETLLGFYQNAVSGSVESGERVILSVDDAHLLSKDTVSDLLALSSLEASWTGKTTLILAGEPGPSFPIKTPNLRLLPDISQVWEREGDGVGGGEGPRTDLGLRSFREAPFGPGAGKGAGAGKGPGGLSVGTSSKGAGSFRVPPKGTGTGLGLGTGWGMGTGTGTGTGKAEELLIRWSPLSLTETGEYIRAKLKAAGSKKALFSGEALGLLHSFSGGFPETIDLLAERALMTAWAERRKEIGPKELYQAKKSLDSPIKLSPEAMEKAGGKLRGEKRQKISQKRPVLYFASIFLLLLALTALFFLRSGTAGQNVRDLENASSELPRGLISGDAAGGGPPAAVRNTLTVIPAGAPALPEEAPNLALPTPPPVLLNLPRNSLILVVDGGLKMARLWQGSLKGPGLKAEISPPDFTEAGLYLVGRPQSRTPLIFRYPPARDIPLAASADLWKRVESQLPQDILPLMVGSGSELSVSDAKKRVESIRERLRNWAKSQEYKFADSMASLYADKFKFMEPGSPERTIDRENFRLALASEYRSSGDIKITMSEPLIMLDPGNHGRAWAVFNLKYDSKLRHDMGQRTLIFERSLLSSEWHIVAELWLREVTLKE
jgi:type II secretory pathway predicted ATPase ExeA